MVARSRSGVATSLGIQTQQLRIRSCDHASAGERRRFSIIFFIFIKAADRS